MIASKQWDIIYRASIIPIIAGIGYTAEASPVLASWYQSGNSRSIVRNCERAIRGKVDFGALDQQQIDALANDPAVAQMCHAAVYFHNISPRGQVILKSLQDKEFSDYLASNSSIMHGLAFSSSGHPHTLELIHTIWRQEGKKLEEPLLTMALGAGLSLTASDNKTLQHQISDRLRRYQYYKSNHADGKLFTQFARLQPWEMAILFSSGRDIEDLSWALAHTENKKNYTAGRAGDAACSFIPYRMKNKDGVSVHSGAAFYDHKPQTLAIYVEYGGVCGAVSTAACGFITSKGIPGYPISQPGHCAFVWRGLDGNWKIGNNIYGWLWSGNRNLSPWPGHPYMVAAVGKFAQYSKAGPSYTCYLLSRYAHTPQNKLALLDQAVKHSSWNLPAWIDLLKIQAANKTEQQRLAIIPSLAKTFKDEPIILQKLVREGLDIKAGKNTAIKIAALILGDSQERASEEMYLMTLSREIEQRITALKGSLKYTVKTRRNYFQEWENWTQNNKISGTTKKQTCDLIEQTLPDLVQNATMSKRLLNTYIRQIELWNDPRYRERGIAFIKNHLKTCTTPENRKITVEAGVKLAKIASKPEIADYFQQTLATQ